jgi:hypothetical protein
MNQGAAIFVTLITIGVLGITGTAVLQGAVDSSGIDSTIISTVYNTQIYNASAVSGNQTVDIEDGIVSSATTTIVSRESILEERVSNGGFENGFTDWTYGGTWGNYYVSLASYAYEGDHCIQFASGGTETGAEYITQDVDFTGADTLTMYYKHDPDSSNFPFQVYVGGTLVYTSGTTYASYHYLEVDVSGYTGVQTLRIGNNDPYTSGGVISFVDNVGLLGSSGVYVDQTYTIDIAGESSSRTTSDTIEWTQVVNENVTELYIITNSSDYDYNIDVSYPSIGTAPNEMYVAQESFIEGIDGSMGMTGTMAIVIVSISVIFLVMRLVQ